MDFVQNDVVCTWRGRGREERGGERRGWRWEEEHQGPDWCKVLERAHSPRVLWLMVLQSLTSAANPTTEHLTDCFTNSWNKTKDNIMHSLATSWKKVNSHTSMVVKMLPGSHEHRDPITTNTSLLAWLGTCLRGQEVKNIQIWIQCPHRFMAEEVAHESLWYFAECNLNYRAP